MELAKHASTTEELRFLFCLVKAKSVEPFFVEHWSTATDGPDQEFQQVDLFMQCSEQARHGFATYDEN